MTCIHGEGFFPTSEPVRVCCNSRLDVRITLVIAYFKNPSCSLLENLSDWRPCMVLTDGYDACSLSDVATVSSLQPADQISSPV